MINECRLMIMASSPVPNTLPDGGMPYNNAKNLRDLPQLSSNEAIKAYASYSIKLSEMTTEFMQKLSNVQKAHSQQLNSLVAIFRKRSQELQKNWVHCEGSHFTMWNDLLDSTDEDAKSYMDMSTHILDDISTGLQTHTAKKKLLFKKLFQYRANLTSIVEKHESDLQKNYKELCDQWVKYGEALDKDQLKENQILVSYNQHNGYVLQKAGFNSIHDIFYGGHVYAILDEIQSVHNDLILGYTDSIRDFIETIQRKNNTTKSAIQRLAECSAIVSSSSDISQFINSHQSTVKYPPPKAMFQLPETTNPKQPELSDNLQLIDLTQAPLLHIMDDLKSQEETLKSARDKLQIEHDSEISLYQSYKNNPALGDHHDIEVEMTHIRQMMRVKDVELYQVNGKLTMFNELEDAGLGVCIAQPQASSDLLSTDVTNSVQPRRTSEMFVQGKEHEWVEHKKKIPVQCRYCGGFIQVPMRPGYVCKVCRIPVHTKCQMMIPYCSGEPPTPSKSPKLTRRVKNAYKKFKSQVATSIDSDTGGDQESSTASNGAETTGIYCTIDEKYMNSDSLPLPPPREQSLAQRQSLTASNRHSLFEATGEWDQPTHCVALYDYDKFNPNDMPLKSGDVIELLNTASVDWWKGSTPTAKGYFPAQYVQVVSPGDKIYRGLYDFIPSDEGEMSLSEGNIVVVSSDGSIADGSGWVYVQCGDKNGLVPLNYLEQIAIV